MTTHAELTPRQLDVAVAEMMGWKNISQYSPYSGVLDGKDWWGEHPHIPGRFTIPHYSTQIADAWQVVQWLEGQADGQICLMRVVDVDGVIWQCEFQVKRYRYEGACHLGDTAPEAICRAALAWHATQEGA